MTMTAEPTSDQEPVESPPDAGANPGIPDAAGKPAGDVPGVTPAPGMAPVHAAPEASGEKTEAGDASASNPHAPPDLHLHSLLGDLGVAFGFFTRLPIPPGATSSLADAARVFSIVGAAIGLAGTLIYVLGLWIGLSAWMAAILAVAGTAVATGALHEDGLADFIDMLGVRGDRLRKLAVMRDSTIGSYGTLALVFASLMKIAGLLELAVPGQVAGALISAHALSRGVLPLVMRSYPLARSDGLAVHAGKPPLSGTYIAFGLGLVLAGIVGGPGVAIVAGISALIASFLVAHIAYRQIGGITGDVLGAAEQVVEIAVIMNFVSFT